MNILPDWQQVEASDGDKRPLNDDQRRSIDHNRHALALLIDPESGSMHQLCASKCFNSQHKDYIEHGESKLKKAERLLDIMRRRSVADFDKLVDALCRCGQRRVAQILKCGGGKLVFFITVP